MQLDSRSTRHNHKTDTDDLNREIAKLFEEDIAPSSMETKQESVNHSSNSFSSSSSFCCQPPDGVRAKKKCQLFAKINKRKHSANHNHEIHLLAREIDDWLPQGVNSMIKGSYTPRLLKRYYFADEMVDQLHISDRIFQHILLKQLKPTFKYVMNPNCYHLAGPTGVKYATQRIRQILQEEQPNYVLRVDIKSFYKSIQHHKLIRDIKKYYDDPKVQTMLENIITNPIETPRGYKNPGHGIALRGPLSQFFSGIFLKPLDFVCGL